MVVNKKITFAMVLALLQISIARAGGLDLYRAVREGQIDTVKTLLAQTGTDVNKGDDYLQWTPLRYAIGGGHTAIVRLLMQAGADIDKTIDDGNESNGETTLLYAVKNGRAEIVRLLIEAGADVNRVDKAGKTPLYLLLNERRENIDGTGITRRPRMLLAETTLGLFARGAELTDHMETMPFFRTNPRTLACCKCLYESRLHHINQFLDESITHFNLEADRCNSVIDHSLLPFMLPEGQLHQLREIRNLRAQSIHTNRSRPLSSDSNRPTKRQKKSNQ